MKSKILSYIKENNLSPWESANIKHPKNTIFKTKDALAIQIRVMTKLSSGFVFGTTKNIWNCFDDINAGQTFFKTIKKTDYSFLRKLKVPEPNWKPDYSIIVATEDEKVFMELKSKKIPCSLISSSYDLDELRDYDLVQLVCIENTALANLSNSIELNSIDDVYLERHLVELSGWKENLSLIGDAVDVKEIVSLLELLNKNSRKISRKIIEEVLIEINDEVKDKIKQLSLSGHSLYNALSNESMPEEINVVIERAISEKDLPKKIFTLTLPVKIDEQELDRTIKEQDQDESTAFAKQLKKNSDLLMKVPLILRDIECELIELDFISGIWNLLENKTFSEINDELEINKSKNIFIDDAQPISFKLSKKERCSILTGANSGGKTTLLEHIVQLIVISKIGLPVSGEVKIPEFSDVYYFAKTKGGLSKGAFETLLEQLAKINPGKNTLILADEIEAVTEPGIAAQIISASAEFFILKNCYLVIATHLGQEIVKSLPKYARIDGIEAKGLDDNFELIVDHNPILGRLAHSTPEFIIEKLANTKKEEYFKFVYDKITKNI